MKRYIIIFLTTFLLAPLFQLTAQNDDSNKKQKENKRKDHFEWFVAERQKFLSKETGMTEKEEKAFFPLYNEMQEKKFRINMEVRKEIRQLKEKKEMTDSDYTHIVDALDEIPVKEAQLTKAYSAKFKKILSPEKLFKFKMAEARFTREVLNQSPKDKPASGQTNNHPQQQPATHK